MSSFRSYGSPVPPRLLDVESTIRDLTQDFCTAFNTANYDHCAKMFAPDGTLMPPNHEPVQGDKAIERLLQHFADLGYEDLRRETIRVEASGDLAVEIGRYTVSFRRKDGTMGVDRGKYVSSWRRLGAWRLVTDGWSSNLPRAAAAEAPAKPLREEQKPEIISPDVPRSA